MDHFRTLLLCKIEGCTELIDLPTEELADFQNLASRYSSETLHLKLALLMAMAEDLKFSAQPRLTLEISFLKIIEATNVVPVASLLGHLETILSALPVKPASLQEALQPQTPLEIKKKTDVIPSSDTAIAEKVTFGNQAQEEEPQEPPLAEPDSTPSAPQAVQSESSPEKLDALPEPKPLEIHPHEKDVRKDWLDFINYVKERKVWMSQDLQRADAVKQDVKGELHLTYSDPANCLVLRQKENHQLLTEFALDFFQKPLKVRFILPEIDDSPDSGGDESPHRKRQQLANDPLVIMAAEIFNGQVGDIRIGPRSR
jgi:DNA polymerase-3 subunit gamma/tau